VDPEVGRIENVYLYDVDELTTLVDVNLADRKREAESAERIVADELRRFASEQKTLGAVPTIKALRERCLGVARAEAERVLGGKLRTLGEAEQREVRVMVEAIVNKLLHPPLTALKREADSELLVRATNALFALDERAPDARQGTPRVSNDRNDRGGEVVAAAGAGRQGGER
jgi:glutamyl-tRNA reductase